MKKNQAGFALIETLLIILILAVVGFGGYYVWQNHGQNKTTKSDTIKTSQPAKTASTTNSPSPVQSYLTIKEWGVKTKISGDESPYYKYVAKGQNDDGGVPVSNDTVFVYSSKFDNSKNADGKACKEVDDNMHNPADYSNPPTRRKFLTVTRFPGSVPRDYEAYAVMPDINIGAYTYVVDRASTYEPGCAVLWRGNSSDSQTDNNIEALDQTILSSLTSDFKTLSAD